MSKAALVKRDSKGRFLPGASPKSPGQPAAVKARRLKEAILRCETEAKVQSVWRRLRKAALAGEAWAVKEYLRYIIGHPKHSYDPRQGSGETDEQQQQGPRDTLEDQLAFFQGAAAAVEAQLRAKETEQDDRR